MFYCEPCRIKNKWPESLGMSYGKCECCGLTSSCYDLPSSSLPSVKTPLYAEDLLQIVEGAGMQSTATAAIRIGLQALINPDAPKQVLEPELAVVKMGQIRAAVLEYYDAMVARKHGGVASATAMNKIEDILGLNYDTYRDSKRK